MSSLCRGGRLRSLLCLGLCIGLSQAARFSGFDSYKPREPNNDDDLVVENHWQWPDKSYVLQIKFVPGSDQVLTIHKVGQIRLYDSIKADVEDYVLLYDMRSSAWSFGDHGLNSVEFHPEWEQGKKQLYLLYTGEPKDILAFPNYAAVKPFRPPDWGPGFKFLDICPCYDCLGTGKNDNGLICEHPYYIDRINVNLNVAAKQLSTATFDVTLVGPVCASSSTHGPGTIINVDGALLFSAGDGSQYTEFDPGLKLDACYNPKAPVPKFQGQFRAQRPDMPQGKVRRIPANLLDSPTLLPDTEVTVVTKGLRNPFRIFHRKQTDTLYVGDVGFGDAGTSERIFHVKDVSTKMMDAKTTANFGWPCLEGVRRTVLGDYALWDSPSEQERLAYLANNTLAGCDGVKAAAEFYVSARVPDYQYKYPGLEIDTQWVAPLFEYRAQLLDEAWPAECPLMGAAITSVFVYDGDMMPDKYKGRLIFSDYSKKCLYMFDTLPDGLTPDTSKLPHLILSGTAIVNLQEGPDGYLYALDLTYDRLIKMYSKSKAQGGGTEPTPAVTSAPTLAPTIAFADAGAATPAETCFEGDDWTELQWVPDADGAYTADLTLGAVEVETAAGTMRTRGWNGMIPGPVMRMTPCNVYKLTVTNNEWQFPDPEGPMNTIRDPTTTNIHLHGLFISGTAPGDSTFTQINPGTNYTYTYTIPCDHVGGTYWYHPHHHGSAALQTNAGAAGMLIVEASAQEAAGTPAAYQNLPEQIIVIQEFSPMATGMIAVAGGDKLFKTDMTADFVLANGCATVDLKVATGIWTKFRILNVGQQFNSVLQLTPPAGAVPCDMVLLGKDGVPLADLPRSLPTGAMFLTMASRVDIAVRCPVAGVAHTLTHTHIGAPAGDVPATLGTISAVATTLAAQADLPAWQPCRPSYLQDLSLVAPAAIMSESLEVREGFNGLLYGGPDDFLETIPLGQVVEWQVAGSNEHPMHAHIYHMQLTSVEDANQIAEVPGWHVTGDWVDTLSGAGIALVRWVPSRFSGAMVMHCHIAEHADNGVMAVLDITGDGLGALSPPQVTDWGTCNGVVPPPTPFAGVAATIPGVIQAENFDVGGEMISYHNINVDSKNINSARPESALEVGTFPVAGITFVHKLRASEWMKYSVNVAQSGTYSLQLSASHAAAAEFTKWTMFVDKETCPPMYSEDGKVGQAMDSSPLTVQTAELAEFYTFAAAGTFQLTAGPHSLIFCVGDTRNGELMIDSFTFIFETDSVTQLLAAPPGP